MTEEEFFDALDFGNPGLEKAGSAWAKKDLDETRKLTATYFRNRTSVPWRFDPHKINRKLSRQNLGISGLTDTIALRRITHYAE